MITILNNGRFLMDLHVCSAVKNRVIGNKRQKVCLIKQGIVTKLLAILNDEGQDDAIRIESVIVLGSLAKGQDEHVYSILSSGAIETLIRGNIS